MAEIMLDNGETDVDDVDGEDAEAVAVAAFCDGSACIIVKRPRIWSLNCAFELPVNAVSLLLLLDGGVGVVVLLAVSVVLDDTLVSLLSSDGSICLIALAPYAPMLPMNMIGPPWLVPPSPSRRSTNHAPRASAHSRET